MVEQASDYQNWLRTTAPSLIAAIAFISVLLVLSRVLILAYDLDPWLFSTIQMGVGGVVMISIGVSTNPRVVSFSMTSGNHDNSSRDDRISSRQRSASDLVQIFRKWAILVRPAFASPYTWAYGLLRVVNSALLTAALVYVSASTLAFLALMVVPLAALASGVIFGRRLARWELPAHAVVLIVLLLFTTQLEDGFSNPALVLITLAQVCVVSGTMIAERHPVNRGSDERQRMILAGAVLLVSAIAFTLTILTGRTVLNLPLNSDVSGTSGLSDIRLWVCAIGTGLLLRGPTLYCELLAIRLSGVVVFVASLAVLPIIVLIFEVGLSELGVKSAEPGTLVAIVLGCLASLSSLAVVAARRRSKHD